MVNFKTTLMYPQFFQKRTKIFEITIMIKFKYSEKATIFCEISSLDLSYVVMVKYIVKISQNCVAFSEYMNFTSNNLFLFFFWKNLMTPKRHFEINWPITFKILKYFLYLFHPVTFFFLQLIFVEILIRSPKLYIPSTLNIAFLQWHTHLNVCAVK